MSPEDSTPEPTPAKPLEGIRVLFRNPISLVGVALALVSLANILFLFLIDLTSEKASPYIGILAYMVGPAILIFALILIPFGLWYDRRRQRGHQPGSPLRYLHIDFKDPNQRGTLAFFFTFVVVFILMSIVGSYRAYEFTDSVSFCGQLCHTVMAPEYTAYQQSPHARVACVECHVGSGASWYVRSKLSGARQVFAVAFNSFPRPIPTPVHNLRPAQETCEECHWPRKFFGSQYKVFTHFASDEKNTQRQIRLLIKTGGGDPSTGTPSGIHWHMNIGNEISYVAADDEHQVIPYVRAKDQQGRVTEYMAKDSPLSKDRIEKSSPHRMDCVDCHNRPTHIYVPPDRSVDESLLARRLDSSLPFIKQQAVSTLTNLYPNTDAAMQGIASDLQKFYLAKYPEVDKDKKTEISNAVAEVQRIYRNTIFPEMKIDWKTHPNNIGHYYFPGCFRCHDGQHVSADGRTIPKTCDICHTVLSQEQGGAMASIEGVAFKHPIDLGDLTQVSCNDCHTGGVSP